MTVATVDEVNENKSNLNAKLKLEVSSQQSINSNYFYSAGSFNFILDQGFKPETLEEVDITSVPFLPSWNKGIVSIHGLIIPVIDILKFTRNQGLPFTNTSTKKRYLLKLEHKNHSPIVFILDSLPRLINTDDFEKINTNKESPKWIKNILKKESVSLAVIEHKELFDQIVNTQK